MARQEFEHPEVISDLEKILEYKAQGFTNAEIKKKMGLNAENYNLRVKYIREGDFFRQQALDACTETIHRMLFTRKLALNGYKETKDDPKRANAAASYLKLISQIDNDIPAVAAQLGFIPKVVDTHVLVTDNEFLQMPMEQLFENYRKAIQ